MVLRLDTDLGMPNDKFLQHVRVSLQYTAASLGMSRIRARMKMLTNNSFRHLD